jgi:hypothetical protein
MIGKPLFRGEIITKEQKYAEIFSSPVVSPTSLHLSRHTDGQNAIRKGHLRVFRSGELKIIWMYHGGMLHVLNSLCGMHTILCNWNGLATNVALMMNFLINFQSLCIKICTLHLKENNYKTTEKLHIVFTIKNIWISLPCMGLNITRLLGIEEITWIQILVL